MQKLLTFGLVCLLLSGCSLMYREDIQQGNVITASMVTQLRPGLTPEQVRYIMGTPLVTNTFGSPERWDYVYSFQPGSSNKKHEQKRVSVFFSNGKVQSIQKEGQF